MTSRIEQITGSTSLEVMAPYINMTWDPITNTGSVTFNMSKYFYVDGVIRSDIPPSNAGMFTVSLSEIMARSFVAANSAPDAVTGGNLEQVSVAGVMQVIKAAFDTLYNEQFGQSDTANTAV